MLSTWMSNKLCFESRIETKQKQHSFIDLLKGCNWYAHGQKWKVVDEWNTTRELLEMLSTWMPNNRLCGSKLGSKTNLAFVHLATQVVYREKRVAHGHVPKVGMKSYICMNKKTQGSYWKCFPFE